jgi:multiple sugar transport system ATP-binding protein
MQNLISVRVKGLDSGRIRALLPVTQRWEGEEVTLGIKPQAIHWFDVQSGDRLSNQSHYNPERARESLNLRTVGNDTTSPQRQVTNN